MNMILYYIDIPGKVYSQNHDYYTRLSCIYGIKFITELFAVADLSNIFWPNINFIHNEFSNIVVFIKR